MSTTQERLDQLASASAAANAVTNDSTSNQVTPPSTPLSPPTQSAGGEIPADAQITPGQGHGQGLAGGIAQTAHDLPSIITHGITDAVNQTVKSHLDLMDWLDAHGILSKGDPNNPDAKSPAGIAHSMLTAQQNAQVQKDQKDTVARAQGGQLIPDSVLPKRPLTGAGEMISGILTFTAGLAASAAVLPEYEGGKIAKATYGAVKGGVAQWFTSDPNGRRLANLVGDNLPLAKVVTDYMSSKPGDTEMEKRMKSGIEGMGFGLAQEALIAGLKLLRVNRLWTDAAGPAKDALSFERQDAIKAVQDSLKKNGIVDSHQNVDGSWTVKAIEQPKPKMVDRTVNGPNGPQVVKAVDNGTGLKNPVTAELDPADARPKLKNGGGPITDAERRAAPSPQATADDAGARFTQEDFLKKFKLKDGVKFEDLYKKGIIGPEETATIHSGENAVTVPGGKFTLHQPEELNNFLKQQKETTFTGPNGEILDTRRVLEDRRNYTRTAKTQRAPDGPVFARRQGDVAAVAEAPKVTLTEDPNFPGTHHIVHPEDGNIGQITTHPEGDTAIQIDDTQLSNNKYKGQGIGSSAYQQLADKTLADGKELWSDSSVSNEAARMYDSLERKGYTVEKNPLAEQGKAPNDSDVWAMPASSKEPVFKVTKGPEVKPEAPATPPVPLEAPLRFETQAEAESYAASLNAAHQENQQLLTRPTTEITPEQAGALHAQIKDLISADNPWLSQSTGIDFNLGKVDTSEETQAALEAVSQMFRKELDAARGGAVLTNDQLLQGMSDFFGANEHDVDKIIADLERADVKPNDVPIRMNAGKVMMDEVTPQVMKWSALMDSNPDNPVAAQWLAKKLQDLVRIAEVTKGRITSSARTTASGRIPLSTLKTSLNGAVKESAQSEADLLGKKFLIALPHLPPDQLQAFARKVSMTNGDPATLLQMMHLIAQTSDKDLANPTWVEKMNFIWTAGILSGPRTAARNLLGNTIALTATPVERYLTGMWGHVTNQFGEGARANNRAIRQEGFDLATGYFTNLQDSVKAAAKAFAQDKPIIESGNLTNEIQNPFQGYLGTAVGLPSRSLMAQDEFFKNMAHRSFVRATALREAAERGMVGEEAADFVTKKMEASMVNGVSLNNNALAFAQNATFTNPLKQGTVGASLSTFTNNHPLFRFAALPFVKTPTNIILWTWDRTPGIAFALKANREALMAGGERAAEVMARQSTGAVAWGAGVYFAANGMLTGSGPKDPVQQKLWRDADNDPYTVRIDGKKIPYSNLDPLLTPFGIIADAVTASGELQAHHEDNIVMAFTTALSRNLASKSYLYGLTDFMNAAFSGKSNTMNEWMKNRVGSFVPSVAKQMNTDPEMREMRTYMDQIIGGIPGLSRTLPARSTFFGDAVMKAPFTGDLKMNPFSASPYVKDTHIEDKLLELGRDFSYPSHNYPGTDVDMTSRDWGVRGNQTAYDRMLELMAHPGDGAPSLKEVLGSIVDADGWDQLSPGVPGIDQGGTQFALINKQVQNYRRIAMDKVYLEFPELAKAVEKSKVTKKVAHKGGQAALDAISGYLNDSN
jgi:hypothetical protein